MPSTAVYRALMLAIEKRRLEMQLSMATVNDMAGLQDGYYAKMIYPDTPSGRQAQWSTLDLAMEAMFGKDYTIDIVPGEMEARRVVSAPTIDKGASTNALKNRHWRHSAHFSDLGRKGAAARSKLPKSRLSAIQRKGAKKRWKRVRQAKRQGQQHAAVNAAKKEELRCLE